MDESVKNQLNISGNAEFIQIKLIDENGEESVLFTVPIAQALQFFEEGRQAVFTLRPDLEQAQNGVPKEWF